MIDPKSFEANPDIIEQLNAALRDGPAYLRFENSLMRGVFVEVVKESDLKKEPHCSTCQCNRVHAEMPTHPLDPKVKRSRSWHHG